MNTTNKQATQKSFTLMELMLAAVIVAILASMALVSYNKAVDQARIDEAKRQVILIHGANEAYKAKHWQYWPNDGGSHKSISEINTNLQINLPTSYTYLFSGDGTSWTCQMQPIPTSNYFQNVHVNQNPINTTGG